MGLSDCGRIIVGEPSERRQTVSIPKRECAGSVRLNSNGQTGVPSRWKKRSDLAGR